MAGEGWTRMPLGKFVTLQRGHDLPDEQRRLGSVPILGSFGITGWHDTAKAPGPGVTVGRSGASFGVVSYSPIDYWPLNTALYVTNFHGNDRRFAYYFLKHFDFRSFNSGSAQPSLNRNFVHPVLIDVPPVSQQRAIAHILGSLDDKIDLNRRMNETLKAMARALLKSWFVDFDPVRAKAEGRNLALSKTIGDLFPESFEDSEMGEIPKGWPAIPLKEVLKEANDRVGNTDVPEYSSTNDGLQLRSERFTKKLSVSNANNKVIRRGYLVFGLSRRLLNFGLMRDDIGSVSAAYRVLTVDHTAIVPDLLERMIRMRVAYFYNAVSASSREGQSVSLDGLGRLCFVQPSKALQEAYYRVTDSLASRARCLEDESRTLAALRDALLPKLLSGEIRSRLKHREDLP